MAASCEEPTLAGVGVGWGGFMSLPVSTRDLCLSTNGGGSLIHENSVF